MTDAIREAIRVELARRNDKPGHLADRVGVSRQFMSAVMNGKAGNLPQVWAKMLDDLGLELVVRARA